MKKYFTIIKTMWGRSLIHRFSIVSYRIGELVEILFLIVMWTALYREHSVISGYTLPEMITYVLIGNLVSIGTRNFLTDFMSREIRDGALSIFVVKPLTYFRYVMTRELGRVSIPFLFSLVTQGLIMIVFIRHLILKTTLLHLGLFVVMVALAFVLELFMAYLIAMSAFWTDEVDGIFTTINRLKRFISGGYFPLSLLPAVYLQVSMALPFAYSFFAPTQLYLGKMSTRQGVLGIGIELAWVGLLYLIIQFVWRRGTRKYEGVGI